MRHWIALLLTCFLGISVCLSGSIAEANSSYTDEEIAAIAINAQRALDIQAVENLMSRHVLYHCYGEHRAEMEEIWVQEEKNKATASFGQNQGYYVGYDAIWDAYVEGHDANWLATAKSYAAQQGIDLSGLSDDEILETYGGMGQLLLHVTTTAIIEVAEDGQTAKGYWYSPGMIAESGQSANSIWEAYGADFIKENGEWKLWHLHMYTDFMCAFGDIFTSVSGNSGPGGQGPSGSVRPDGQGPNGNGPGREPPAGDEGDHGAPPDMPSTIPDQNPDGGVSDSTEASAEKNDSNSVVSGQIAYEGEQGAKELAYASGSYVFSTQYTEFSTTRLRSQMETVPIPLPYATWSFDESNFCPTIEEYAMAGVDVSDWE